MRILQLLILSVAFAVTGCNDDPQGTSKNKATEKVEKKEQKVVTKKATTDGHTAEIALDWNGIYQGLTPCASCPGILTTVKLNSDKTFEKTDVYLESKDGYFSSKGSFSFTDNGSKIVLNEGQMTRKYAVGENTLTLLDDEGKKSTSEFASMYDLPKLSDKNMVFTTDKTVKGLFTYGHEVQVFSPCGSAKTYWLSAPNANLAELYREKTGEQSAPYTPVMIELVAKDVGKAKEGFAEMYDGVLEAIEIKSVEPITADNYCGK